MLSKVRTALEQAVEEVVKELDSSYEQTKRYNESLRGNNRLLMKRIKELKGRCVALQEERDKFAREIVRLQDALKVAELVNTHPEMFPTIKVQLSDESKKIAELNKEVADLQKKNRELSEQLENKSFLDPVFAHKYFAQQIALKSDIGEVFECEFNDGLALETGYYLRISKKSYELAKEGRLPLHVVKRSDK